MIYLTIEADDPADTVNLKAEFTVTDPLKFESREVVLRLLADGLGEMAEDRASY